MQLLVLGAGFLGQFTFERHELLAQLTQAPVIPISYVVSRQFVFKKAWDNFAVPLPFARCTVRIGTPITVPRDADEATSENKRLELEQILQSLSGNAS